MKLKNELFPTVPFSSDRREMFSEQIHTAAESVLNNSLWSMGKGMSTTTTVGKSSHFLKYKGMKAQCTATLKTITCLVCVCWWQGVGIWNRQSGRWHYLRCSVVQLYEYHSRVMTRVYGFGGSMKVLIFEEWREQQVFLHFVLWLFMLIIQPELWFSSAFICWWTQDIHAGLTTNFISYFAASQYTSQTCTFSPEATQLNFNLST
jgi:hypothetical protein